MAAVIVRPMQSEDLEAAAAIEATALDAWSLDSMRVELSNHMHGHGVPQLFVAELEGRIAGLAVFHLVLDEISLYTITVDPALRGQGIGRALLEGGLQDLQRMGGRFCYLEVRSQNAPARALYEHMGFETVGKRKNFYQNPPDDAVLMCLDVMK